MLFQNAQHKKLYLEVHAYHITMWVVLIILLHFRTMDCGFICGSNLVSGFPVVICIPPGAMREANPTMTAHRAMHYCFSFACGFNLLIWPQGFQSCISKYDEGVIDADPWAEFKNFGAKTSDS